MLWQAGDLLPVTRNAVPLFEALCQKPVLKKARRANLPKEVLAEIERDSRWPDGSKKMLADTGSALAAKYLNKSGVSAAFKDEVNFGVALCSIAAGQIALQRRLDALIAASQAPAPAVASGPAPAR